MTGRVWFVTGANSGFGRAIASAALSAGDRVVATARNTATLVDLADSADVRTAQVDVTDRAAVERAVAFAIAEFGRIDVLVNNAGYGLRGAVEELDDAELRREFETNVFGVVTVTRAVLPTMREQGDGHIVQMSSVGAVDPQLGSAAYGASKAALEGLSAALAKEVAPFGIRVTIFEPGPFRTDFSGRSLRWAEPLEAYRSVLDGQRERAAAQDGHQPGDPDAAARVIVEAVGRDDLPLRVPIGPQAFDRIRETLGARLAELDNVEGWARETSFDDR